MVVKVYNSGISGNKELKKRQQRVLMILDSRNIKYEVAEPGKKDYMQNNSTSLGGTVSDPTPRHPLPPQIFNNTTYCGVNKISHTFIIIRKILLSKKFPFITCKCV